MTVYYVGMAIQYLVHTLQQIVDKNPDSFQLYEDIVIELLLISISRRDKFINNSNFPATVPGDV